MIILYKFWENFIIAHLLGEVFSPNVCFIIRSMIDLFQVGDVVLFIDLWLALCQWSFDIGLIITLVFPLWRTHYAVRTILNLCKWRFFTFCYLWWGLSLGHDAFVCTLGGGGRWPSLSPSCFPKFVFKRPEVGYEGKGASSFRGWLWCCDSSGAS